MTQVQVIGPGCSNCQKLESLCREVIDEEELQVNLEKVEEMDKITEMGVMLTPALAIDGEIKVSGKIPVKSTLKNWLRQAAV